MKNKTAWWTALAAFLLTVCAASPAQVPRYLTLSGLIDDYTPVAVMPNGPWEIRGDWNLKFEQNGTLADFTATLSMEHSDLWVIATASDPNNTAARIPHAHIVKMKDGTVTALPGGGFQVVGPATVSASGNAPPFGDAFTLTVMITGGTLDTFSNIKLLFSAPASSHFGTQPINGVVHTRK